MNATMPPPPDRATQLLGDRVRRHYDAIDAEAIVRRMERDYGVRLRAEPCAVRRGLQHIEFALALSETARAVLTRYADGYHPADIALYFPDSSPERLGSQLSYIAKETGLLSRHHLVAVAIYFGIVTPSMMLETGDYF